MVHRRDCIISGYSTLHYPTSAPVGALLVNELSTTRIELVHRFFDAAFDDGFGCLVCSVDRGFDGGQILFGGTTKDVADLIVSVSGFADTNADAGEGFVVKRVDDGF